jgi:glutathione-regulated potassium-efflux system ancillary protein KefG
LAPSVLVLLAHPATHVSRVNRALAAVARDVPGITVHDLYAAYPNFFIDVRAEQARLLAHSTLVFQHPFYWYSVPALLKEWIDVVLERGWAYGPGGTQLQGKRWAHALTTGAAAGAYDATGSNRYTLVEFLRPLEQTARLCHTTWLAPFVIHGARTLDEDELAGECARYRDWLAQLAGDSA